MFGNIDDVHGMYRSTLAAVGSWFVGKSEKFGPKHNLWNSPEQFELRDKLEYLRGIEDALGLTEEEANTGRLAVGLPERRVAVRV